MASEPSQSAVCASLAQTDVTPRALAEQAIFVLTTPLKCIVEGVETDIHGLGMRELAPSDRPLLDRFRGQPVALAQNVIAALCELPFEEVVKLDFEDFAMLAEDALFQVEQLSIAVGLPPRFFFQPQVREEAA